MKTPRARSAPKASVKADPKLMALWKKTLAEMHAHEKKSAQDWDREWEAAGRIIHHDPPLWTLGGYKSDDEFFVKELGVNDRVGRAFVRVAEHATPEDETKLTVWKLDAALGYLEATRGPLPPRTEVAFARVKIAGKPLAECSIAFIKKQTSLANAKTKPRAQTAYRHVLALSLAKHSAFEKVDVREHAGTVSFHRVPNAALHKFANVLARTKLPELPSKRGVR